MLTPPDRESGNYCLTVKHASKQVFTLDSGLACATTCAKCCINCAVGLHQIDCTICAQRTLSTGSPLQSSYALSPAGAYPESHRLQRAAAPRLSARAAPPVPHLRPHARLPIV